MTGVYDTVCAAIKSALDAVYVKKSNIQGLLKNDGTVDTNSYQQALVSGSNIKTINNQSVLGSGNISISGGGSVDIVTQWESTPSDAKVASEKLTKDTLDAKANSTHTHTYSNISNVTTVDVYVFYSDGSGEMIKLLKYTGS